MIQPLTSHRMIRFDRADLIRLVEEHAPTAGIRRRCAEGHVEVLGAFDAIPPHREPGFIVLVRHVCRSKPDLVAIGEDTGTRRPRLWQVSAIPWQTWLGDSAQPFVSITTGDNPAEYRRRKELSL